MIKRILVGLGDLPHTRSAATAAIQIAQSVGGELTGVTLFDPNQLESSGPVPIGGGAYAKELEESRVQTATEVIAAATRAFVTSCQQAQVPHAVVHERGDPLTLLCEHVRYHDLIVCGQRGLFQHGVIDEPTDQLVKLVQAAVRPLLAVPEQEHPIKRVLIAYSGSVESAKTMKRFVQFGLYRDAALRIVTFQEDAAAGETLLEHAAAYCRAHGLDPETECVADAPQKQLLPYAEARQCDLVVLGNSSRNLLLRRLFGETALHTMRNADRPLFLSQ